ncbi:MAG: aminotransferase class V-fold PLP-dependent enzyme [Chlamydiia bacterium]|nr:aminotransferase class V-fold PLP-dependent enzyme [Chlamydiia bacterium]
METLLDSHEKAPICGPALDSLQRAWSDQPAIETQEQIIRDLVGASSEDAFVFTSSGAEAVTQVLWSVYMEAARKEGKCHFLASALEDLPTMQMLKRLEELGCFAKIIPVTPSGEIDLKKLPELISPRTALLSVQLAQALTGVIQPIEELVRITKERNILLHLDASYAVGKIYFSFADLGADYLTFSGETLHASPASGALFAKPGAPLSPLIMGGKGLRGGPLDLPAFLSLAAASGQASLSLERMSLEVARLRHLFETEMKRACNAQVLFADSYRLPNVSCLFFPGVHQEALLYLLSRKQIDASIGGRYPQHLHRLLQASHMDLSIAESSLSFAFSRMTTEAQILQAIPLIADAVATLRRISEEL